MLIANRSTTARAKPTGLGQPNEDAAYDRSSNAAVQELMPESKNLCLQNGAGSETISQREE
jgi:hypothetical protein